jgi:lysophospholipase L1-like esterase
MQKIRIDFDNPGLPQHISVVENDSQSRFFQATLYENGKAYTAPAGASYSIMYRGFGPQNQGWYDTINDGAGKRAACTAAGNTVTCEIARQALQVPGHVSIVLCVTTGKGYMLKSWPIECNCKNDRYDSTTEIESFFYITQISNADWTQAIQAWENLKDAIDPTLSLSGKAADAKATGDALKEETERAKGAENQIEEDLNSLSSDLGENGLALKNDLSELFAENTVFLGSGITVKRKNNVLEYTKLKDTNISYTGVFFPTLNRLAHVFTNTNFVLIGNSSIAYLAFAPNPTATIHGVLFSISKITGNSIDLGTINYPIKSQNIEFNIVGDVLYIVDDKANIAHISKWEYNGIQYDKCLGFYFGNKSEGTFSLKNNYITNMAVVGDSISALDMWQKTVSEHFMCNYTNYAVSGTSFSKPGLADTSQSFEERVKNITGDYDTIVVFGGTNDFGHSVSLEVFEQSVNNTLTTLCTKYPTAKMFLITPPQRSDMSVNMRNNTLWEFVEVLKKCAQKYGFKVVDAYSESGITTFNTNVYTKDNLHPNGTGMAMIANCFISNVHKYYRRFSKSLFPYLHKIG